MKSSRVFGSAIALIALVVVLAAILAPDSVAKDKYIWKITAKAHSLAGASNALEKVDIGIVRWSSDAERAELLTAAESGTDAVTKKLKEMPVVGYVATGSVRRDLHYIHQFKDGDNTRIVFATNRIINYSETRSSKDTTDYTVALGEVNFNEKGKGDGKLAPACKVKYNRAENKFDIGNNALQPARLTAVRARQPE